eukprot:4032240-Amphidinium_carterae.1
MALSQHELQGGYPLAGSCVMPSTWMWRRNTLNDHGAHACHGTPLRRDIFHARGIYLCCRAAGWSNS